MSNWTATMYEWREAEAEADRKIKRERREDVALLIVGVPILVTLWVLLLAM